MKYIKRQTTNARGTGLGRGVHVTTIDKEVILDSENVVLVPKGRTEDRPQFPKNGHLRYNTDHNRFEVYEAGRWDGLRNTAPSSNAPITVQSLGNGDAFETVFGPLNSGDPFYPVPAAAENVLVFVENVYQLPNTNYSLVQNPSGKPAGWYLEFASAVDAGKPVTVLHNFDK
jgi:hypothetical protein